MLQPPRRQGWKCLEVPRTTDATTAEIIGRTDFIMRIKIESLHTTAINMGRNSNVWYTEIDVTSLTDEQKKYLISKINTCNNEPYISAKEMLEIVDQTGNITPDSISYNIEKWKKHFDAVLDQQELKIDEFITKGIIVRENITHINSLSNENLTQQQIERRDFIQSKIDAVVENNRKIEQQKKIDAENAVIEWDNKLRPEVEKYLAGGEREFPSWVGTWAGSKGDGSLFEKIQSEDTRRSDAKKEAEDLRKKQQLTEAVNRLGTDLQKKKWEAGLMARAEVLGLLWNEAFAPLEDAEISSYKTNEYVHNQVGAEYHDAYWKQDKKTTLTDLEFESLQKAISLITPDKYEIYTEYDKNEDDDHDERITLARLYKTVGEYTLECDIIIS